VHSSLYIHIPFCRSKCRYCDFVSIAGKEGLIDAYLDAVAGEWRLHERSGSYQFTTVYIGGGTPSLLTVHQWERFREILLGRLPVLPGAEWSVECNPGSWSAEKARLFAAMGVNRLTLGIQSMDDRLLRAAGRPHSAREAEEVLGNPLLHSFHSIGVDVMFGLPGQTVASFERTLRAVLDRPVVSHLSAYELTLAEHTPFGRHRSLLPLPDEATMSAMTELLHSTVKGFGFTQYEVSNFSRDGFRCRHNCAYWDHAPYIGLGCSAHSYLHPRRFWNIRDIERYCSMINRGTFPVEREERLDADTLAREMVFLGLRRTDGLNEAVFLEKTGMIFRRWAGEERLMRFIDERLIEYQPPWWKTTSRGMLCADYIARELF
jgi:oxygen-independent coproporphyrinogen-3 oxidase